MLPARSTATVEGPRSWASIAGPPSPAYAPGPVPAIVVMIPSGDTLQAIVFTAVSNEVDAAVWRHRETIHRIDGKRGINGGTSISRVPPRAIPGHCLNQTGTGDLADPHADVREGEIPAPSSATPQGDIPAWVAGPPSPLNPEKPLPATVVMILFAETIRIRLLRSLM